MTSDETPATAPPPPSKKSNGKAIAVVMTTLEIRIGSGSWPGKRAPDLGDPE